MTASFDDLEAIYERLAEAIDKAGPGKSEVFLTKLVLALANEVGDAERVGTAIESCLLDL